MRCSCWGAGDVQQLESLDPSAGRHVRTAAEIHELAVAIRGDRLARLGELLNEVDLHEVAFGAEARQPLIAWDELAFELFITLDYLLHALLDLFQVLGRERRRPVEIVEESVLGGRAVTQLGLREQLQDGGSQHVRRGMPVNLQRVGVAFGEQAQLSVLFQRLGEVHKLPAVLGRSGMHAGRRLLSVLGLPTRGWRPFRG